MIQLAAGAWGITWEAALVKLVRKGFDIPGGEPTPEMLESQAIYYSRNERLHNTWNEARGAGLQFNRKLQQLANKMELFTSMTQDWMQRGPNQIMGGIDYKEVEACFHEGTITNSGVGGGRNRIFTGKGWGDVIILPMYDVPGRIKSYYIVGRNANEAKGDHILNSTYNWLMRRSATYMEPGISCYPGTWNMRRGTVFAVDSVELYLRLHLRHFRLKAQPLPLLLWHADEKHLCTYPWNMFEACDKVFWTYKLTPDVLHQAIETNGRISLAGPIERTTERMREFLYRYESEEFLRRIDRSAKHWIAVLNERVPSMDDSEVEELFFRLRINLDRLKNLLGQCNREVHDRVLSLMLPGQSCRTVTIDRKHVEERKSGWHLLEPKKNEEELVSDAILRIDKTICHPQAEKTYYQGRVVYKDEAVPFCVRDSQLERDPFDWMKDFLVRQQKGLMIYNPTWSRKAISLACQFNEPEFVTGIESVGWDNETASFVLPNYVIRRDGTVEDFTNLAASGDTPARDIPRPDLLLPEDIEYALGNTEEHTLAWAVWGSIVANIVAPMINRPSRGIAVVGSSTAASARLASNACDCLYRQYPYKPDDMLELEQSHRWPLTMNLSGDARVDRVNLYLAPGRGEERNCLARVSLYQAMVLALNGGWNVVHGPESPEFLLTHISKKILPAYLKHAVEDIPDTLTQKRELVLNVLDDTAAWLAAQGFDTTTIKQAAEHIWPSNDYGNAHIFAELICQLYNEGLVTTVPEDYSDEPNAIWSVMEHGGLFIPKGLVVAALEKKHTTPLEPFVVSQHLMEAGVLIGELDLHDKPGWLINADWLQKVMKNWRANTARLKIREG